MGTGQQVPVKTDVCPQSPQLKEERSVHYNNSIFVRTKILGTYFWSVFLLIFEADNAGCFYLASLDLHSWNLVNKISNLDKSTVLFIGLAV